MISFTVLPTDLFERSLSDEELYIEIYRYYAYTIGKEGFKVRDEWVSAKSVDLNENEVIYVPTITFLYESEGVIRGIDLVIYAYLCYRGYKNKTGYVKLDVTEIAMKTKIRKTEIRVSINNLVREECLHLSDKSGYYLIGELEYPDLYEDILYYFLKWKC